MKQIIYILIITFVFYLLLPKSHSIYSQEEQALLWDKAKNGDKDATNKLLLYYTTDNLKKNYKKISQLQYMGLDKESSLSCYLYGKFLTQHFPKDSQEFQDGVYWLKHSKKLGSKDAEFLLNRIEKR